jgi:hypothetical protein
MKKQLLTYSLLILCAVLHVQGFGQDYIETIDDNSYGNSDFAQSDAHKKYLNSEQEITEFDEDQWQIIKRSIAEGMSEDYYELVDSGGYVLEDVDNPYKQSKKSYKKYWREKNAHRAKRLPKEKQKKQNIDIPDVNIPSSPVLSNVLIVVVILGLAVLIFFLFFNAPVNQNNRKISQDLGSVIPTEIPKTELELMLEKALQKEDYREAIRVYFIFIIRGLIVKDWIEWEKEKTNFSYLMEMRDKPLSAEFESTVSVYEIVWYGKRELTKKEYKVLEPRFKDLTKKLDQ